MRYGIIAGQYFEGKRPWGVDDKIDVAIPGATQNEIELEDAKALVKSGVKVVLEGANMPSTSDAIEYFHKNKVEFGCAKVSLVGCRDDQPTWRQAGGRAGVQGHDPGADLRILVANMTCQHIMQSSSSLQEAARGKRPAVC